VDPAADIERVALLRERVRIGEGMGRSSLLAPEPVARAVAALGKFRGECEAARVGRIEAVATSAVREAANREAFLDLVRQETSLTLRVLSGEEEARAGYLGTVNALPLEDGSVLDLGGGSAQLAEVRGRRMGRAASLPLGAVRLTERFLLTDPPRRSDIEALEGQVRKTVAAVSWLRAPQNGAVAATGGTARALAKLDRRARRWPIDRLHGYELTLPALEALIARMAPLTAGERESLPGLRKERADIILAGALAIRGILRAAGADRLWISADGLREGLFYPFLFRPGADPVVPSVRSLRIRGVEDLARRAGLDPAHGVQVADLVLRLAHGLAPLLWPTSAEQDDELALLEAAGRLADLPEQRGGNGLLEALAEAPLPGFLHRHLACLALMLHPKPDALAGPGGVAAILAPGESERIGRLSALLALARVLDTSRSRAVADVDVTLERGRVRVTLLARADVSREIARTAAAAEPFRRAFGRALEVAAR
jgi:exopolyphosphatase/guanosine-5'-triphosphate,3'-diphosphate pyrophosphatase